MLTELLTELVATDSVNPSLVPGGAGEREAAALIARWADGLDVRVLERTPGRPSVVVTARGSGGGRSLLLCGHTDTVGGVATARVDGDRLYGRGAYDMKGGLAAALVACRSVSGLRGDVIVAAVADEEHASLGVQEVLETVRADAAIVCEPTEERVAIAHKGFVWAELEVDGVAAHGSRPHLGVDAIVRAAPVLGAIGELDARLAGHEHPLVGRGSVHAGAITGGGELSSYPASCVIGVERRTLPGETLAGVEAEFAALGADRFTTGLVREPFEIDAGHDLVRSLGGDPVGVSYWADSAFIAAAGIPTVLYGPAGEGAHADVEWVSLESCERVATTLTEVAREWCA